MIQDKLEKSAVGPQWNRIGTHHHHGVNIPLSALHSEKSCGIGEFYDLIPLIDWCHSLKMDVIQLLPLNDTGDDPSPYFAESSLALNPLFLSLHRLPHLNKMRNAKAMIDELRTFNHTPRVAYHDVQSRKIVFLRTYFEEVGAETVKTKAFETFIEQNPWVEEYALFKVLKDSITKNHWLTWPDQLQTPTPKLFDELIQKYWIDVCFYIMLQFFCFEQLQAVKKYANDKGVFLKGDIPILISPDSADVWLHTDEFDMTLTAGAPPDMYTEEGQVWGFPIFKWEVMKERGFHWWKQRLGVASTIYDIYRIDHILGFFRIWAIPHNTPSKEGRFIPEDETLWLAHGKELLSMMAASCPMLPIGEDLGLVPDAVRICLSDLGICGTKVPRWERNWDAGGYLISATEYNPISMTTVSTHDSETLGQWWSHYRDEAKLYADSKHWDCGPTLLEQQRRYMLWESHHSSSLFHVNLLGEYLALFPELIWEDPNQERINIPGKVLPENWTYRTRLSIEKIVAHDGLKKRVGAIVHSPDPHSLFD